MQFPLKPGRAATDETFGSTTPKKTVGAQRQKNRGRTAPKARPRNIQHANSRLLKIAAFNIPWCEKMDGRVRPLPV